MECSVMLNLCCSFHLSGTLNQQESGKIIFFNVARIRFAGRSHSEWMCFRFCIHDLPQKVRLFTTPFIWNSKNWHLPIQLSYVEKFSMIFVHLRFYVHSFYSFRMVATNAEHLSNLRLFQVQWNLSSDCNRILSQFDIWNQWLPDPWINKLSQTFGVVCTLFASEVQSVRLMKARRNGTKQSLIKQAKRIFVVNKRYLAARKRPFDLYAFHFRIRFQLLIFCIHAKFWAGLQ